ncbi:MAG: ArsR/SmtB family transcription factor [Candidatus Hodarchaeales archaeon]
MTQIDEERFKTRIVQLLGKCEDIENAEDYYQNLKGLSTNLKSEELFLFIKSIFEVLGNTDRLLIINALREKDRCSCELEALLRKSQPAISRDLRKLEEVKLIQGWKKGKFIHYSLVKPTFNQLRKSLDTWFESIENWFGELELV